MDPTTGTFKMSNQASSSSKNKVFQYFKIKAVPKKENKNIVKKQAATTSWSTISIVRCTSTNKCSLTTDVSATRKTPAVQANLPIQEFSTETALSMTF